ncbi:hypothetical protein [Pseudonocardia abyssalis]|uniref:Uncharacterized protein n=1 Tax=Pseudonocardia abyssalis TaxID=2792008 RepID=A0ABS6UXV5_9PSEU|nr:hypothetical protein [Pseudonocardia abyssalis]MBW0137086.1 hypothetical protein [Pseudonocardia abyssalis]
MAPPVAARHRPRPRLDLPDPLGEEPARRLHEGTADMAGWRELGIYRAARPVPDGASCTTATSR